MLDNISSKKSSVKLYNVMFPIWMFFLWPTYLWLIILPINFVIDSLVVCLAMKRSKIENIKENWKKSILRIWIIGFISDLIGAALILMIMLILENVNISWNLILFPGTTLISIPGVIVAGILIYYMNRRFAFRKCDFMPAQIRRYSLALAIFTAPYAMLIPIYG